MRESYATCKIQPAQVWRPLAHNGMQRQPTRRRKEGRKEGREPPICLFRGNSQPLASLSSTHRTGKGHHARSQSPHLQQVDCCNSSHLRKERKVKSLVLPSSQVTWAPSLGFRPAPRPHALDTLQCIAPAWVALQRSLPILFRVDRSQRECCWFSQRRFSSWECLGKVEKIISLSKGF